MAFECAGLPEPRGGTQQENTEPNILVNRSNVARCLSQREHNVGLQILFNTQLHGKVVNLLPSPDHLGCVA